MNAFMVVLIVLGIILVVGFLAYEIVGLIKDIRKAVKKKKEKTISADSKDEK